MTTPVFYAQAQGAGVVLGVEPALASWDRASSLGQVRSAAFIDEVHGAVAEPIRATPGPLALRLDVGLASSVPLHTAHDLDNYLFPLVPKTTARTGRDFVCVWATKRHAATSSVGVATAVPAEDPGGACVFEVRTTASASTTAYKEQIRDQVAAAEPLPGGGVALQLAFVVGPRRAWPNLWKATIDALGSVLGRDDGAREWNARDGRVTDLGLHCTVDPAAGNEITIAVRASAGSESTAA
ncbi:conserved hypothetical protein [Frankia sp. Hr75.2]|nr:conserved hypothetical protein [Frankia sp. Hr75.2]